MFIHGALVALRVENALLVWVGSETVVLVVMWRQQLLRHGVWVAVMVQ